MQEVHRRAVREMSDGDVLSDKSASSSTGSVQMSADSTAASTDSVTAPSETLSSTTSGVVKIADIPLPDDRPHTISSAVYQPPVRPPIIPDTFEPPTVTSGPLSKVADIYGRPSLIVSKDNRNTAPVAVATPTVPVATNPFPRDDCVGVVPGSAQHSCAEPSTSQKRKTVSSD